MRTYKQPRSTPMWWVIAMQAPPARLILSPMNKRGGMMHIKKEALEVPLFYHEFYRDFYCS
ncbi:hypothetical protein EZV61_04200 [Corallincola luteus]|uniref:Uncharacterized protein n=1 Tax=Corallincola luteus TaxID=1775177 RepID=A0ABY2ASJ7_9GAMM|nr:hypothetical protein [Corallincola luteus]TCI05172.1 hypothetical protein EZV61_04200 [Corallincola luteus]